MKKLFLESVYSDDFPNRNDVLCIDALPINRDQLIKVALIDTNSSRKQGVIFSIDAGRGYVEYKERRTRGIPIWWDGKFDEITFKCHSIAELVSIYNIYEDDNGVMHSLMYKSGMLVEEKDNKRIYHCNDVNDGDIRFDKLVFSVEKLKE